MLDNQCDEKLFLEHFYPRTRSIAQWLLPRLLDDLDDREEVFQECNLRLIRNFATLSNHPAPNGYIVVWMQKCALSHIKKNARFTLVGDHTLLHLAQSSPAPLCDSTFETMSTEDTLAAVQTIVDGFRETRRQAFVQCVILQRDYAEVAQELGITPGTLRNQILAGRKAIKKALFTEAPA